MGKRILPLDVSVTVTEDEQAFYRNAALYAMQGFIESAMKVEGVVSPELLAEDAFVVADAMLKTYKKKTARFSAYE